MSYFIGNSATSAGLLAGIVESSFATDQPTKQELRRAERQQRQAEKTRQNTSNMSAESAVSHDDLAKSIESFELSRGFKRPSLWLAPRNYFNLPPLVTDPEWVPFPEAGLRFDFDDDFKLHTLGEAYQIWKSGQYYGFSGYSLWPTNTSTDDFSTPHESGDIQNPTSLDSSSESLLDVSTLPTSLDDLLNPGEEIENPLEAESLTGDDAHSSLGDYSSSGYGSTKKVDSDHETKAETIEVIPLVPEQQTINPVIVSVEEAPVQSECVQAKAVIEVFQEQVLTPAVSSDARVVMRVPQAEVPSVSNESFATSVTVFILPEMGSSGLAAYFASGVAFLKVTLAGRETFQDIFSHEIFPVTLDANLATVMEAHFVSEEPQAGGAQIFWQDGSHLSTVSFAAEPDSDSFDQRHDDMSLATNYHENGASQFRFTGNINSRVYDREVYLHSGVMLAQTGNRGFSGSRMEETLFLQQASRRLNTVSQNDSKDHGGDNPNSRAREIYQIALDEDFDEAQIPSEPEDEIEWQPHPNIIVDTILV